MRISDLSADVCSSDLLNPAAPSGPASMISSAGAMRGFSARGCSQGCGSAGMRRCETENPHSPALGLPPRPVAPSSRISPPAPVDAPAHGELAVGWLWVSALLQNALSRVDPARYAFVCGSGRKRLAGYPSPPDRERRRLTLSH